MKAMFVYAEKNSFVDQKTGEVIDYCKMTFLTPIEPKENCVGYKVINVTTKMNNYSKIKDFVSIKNQVEIEEKFDPAKDGLFKRKIAKINDFEL